jgi:UDPglucose 6-dehydrogenase
VSYFGKHLKGKQITVWGLSFKPNTDDMREAPAITIVEHLRKKGARVHVYDPVAIEEAKKYFGKSVKYFDNYYDALKGSHAVAVVTEWNEFRRPDFDKMKSLMKEHVVFDGRNIYSPVIMAEKGFVYFGIGRGTGNGEG